MRKDTSIYGRKADWRKIADNVWGPRENDPKWQAWVADAIAKPPGKRTAAEKEAIAHAMKARP